MVGLPSWCAVPQYPPKAKAEDSWIYFLEMQKFEPIQNSNSSSSSKSTSQKQLHSQAESQSPESILDEQVDASSSKEGGKVQYNISISNTDVNLDGIVDHSKGKDKKNEGRMIYEHIEVSHAPYFIFGRNPDVCDYLLEHISISRKHAAILQNKDGEIFLWDFQSTHGTYLNGRRIKANIGYPLLVGHEIRFAESSRKYVVQKKNTLTGEIFKTNDVNGYYIQQRRSLEESRSEKLDRKNEKVVEDDEIEEIKNESKQITNAHFSSQNDENGEKKEIIEMNRKIIDDYKIPVTSQITLRNPGEGNSTKRPIRALAIDKTGSWVAAGGSNSKISCYDFNRMNEAHEPIFTVEPSEGCTVVGASFSPNADSLVVATDSVCPCILNSLDGKIKLQFIKGDIQLKDPKNTKGHIGNVTSCCWHSLDDDALITSGFDGTIRLWRPETGNKTLRQLTCDKVYKTKNVKNKTVGVSCCIYSMNGEYIIAGCVDGSIQIFDATSSNISDPIPFVILRPGHGENCSISGLIIHPNGQILASRGFDNSIRLWNMHTITSNKNVAGYPGISSSKNEITPIAIIPNIPSYREQSNLVFSPCGKLLCTGTNADDHTKKGKLLFYNIENVLKLIEMPYESESSSLHDQTNQHHMDVEKTLIEPKATSETKPSTINSIDAEPRKNLLTCNSYKSSNKPPVKGKFSLTSLAGPSTKSALKGKFTKFTELGKSSASSSNGMSFKTKRNTTHLPPSSSLADKINKKDEKTSKGIRNYGEKLQHTVNSGSLPFILEEPCLSFPLTEDGISIIHLIWHPLLNQIFVSTTNGATVVYYDEIFSKYGAVISSKKKARKRKDAQEGYVAFSDFNLDGIVKAKRPKRKVGALTPEIQQVTLEQYMVQSALLEEDQNEDLISAIARQKVTKDPNRVLENNTVEQEVAAKTKAEKNLTDFAKRYY